MLDRGFSLYPKSRSGPELTPQASYHQTRTQKALYGLVLAYVSRQSRWEQISTEEFPIKASPRYPPVPSRLSRSSRSVDFIDIIDGMKWTRTHSVGIISRNQATESFVWMSSWVCWPSVSLGTNMYRGIFDQSSSGRSPSVLSRSSRSSRSVDFIDIIAYGMVSIRMLG